MSLRATIPQSGRVKKLAIYVGEKFFRLTVVAVENKTDGHGRRYHLCVCSCRPGQKPKKYREDFLRGGRTKSCGCLRAATQWNFGTTKQTRKRRNGVGEVSVPPASAQIQHPEPVTAHLDVADVAHVLKVETDLVLSIDGKHRREACSKFNAAIARLTAEGQLSGPDVPNFSSKQILEMMLKDEPKISALPPCLQKPTFAIMQKLWNGITSQNGGSMSRGSFILQAPAGRGLLVTGGYDSDKIDEVDTYREPNEGGGHRVRPAGNGPDSDDIRGEETATTQNFSKREPKYTREKKGDAYRDDTTKRRDKSGDALDDSENPYVTRKFSMLPTELVDPESLFDKERNENEGDEVDNDS